MRKLLVVATIVLCLAGCKARDAGKDKGKAPAPAPAEAKAAEAKPAEAKPAAVAGDPRAIPLEAGEVGLRVYEAGDQPNPYVWTVGGEQVLLGVVDVTAAKPDADGKGRLAAVAGGKAVTLARWEYNPAYDNFATLVPRGDDLIFLAGDAGGSGDPGHVDAYLLRWDAAKKEDAVAEQWSGSGDDEGTASARLPRAPAE